MGIGAPARRQWMARAASGLRLLAATSLLAAGAIVVVPAQGYRWWQLSLVLIEFGYLVAPLALVLLWPGWHRTRMGLVTAASGAAAGACLLAPVVRAIPVAAALPAALTSQFGDAAARPHDGPDAPARPRPLDPLTLFHGIPVPEVPVERLVYARRADEDLELDLYRLPRPAEAPPAPIVVVIHGGGWQSGSPSDLPALSRYLAAHGYVVAAPEYRLAPAHPFPAAFDDLRTAIDFLRGRARSWQADADGVVTLGRSAGAHLALLVAYTAGRGAVRGSVALYAPADLRFGWDHPGNPMVYDGTTAIEQFLGGPPDRVPAAYVSASPFFLVGAETPPTLLIHGRKDEIVWVEQSRRLARRLQEAGRPHLLIELPWATHGCDFVLSGPCGQITLYAVERFLAAVTAH